MNSEITKKIKNKLRFIKKNNFILLLWNIRRLKSQKKSIHKHNDIEYINHAYLNAFNKNIDWNSPKTFTEKVQWIKLNYRNPLMTTCVDKIEVHKYVKEIGYEHLLNNILFVWSDINEIDFDLLPNKFVIKASHGSSMHLIVNDKKDVSWFWWKRIMNLWLKQNIYIDGREWQYKNVKPRLLCEEFIDTKGLDLKDYKFFCFDGEPKYIQVDGDRFVKHKRAFYDIEWERQEFQYGDYDIDYEVEEPSKLNEMLDISRKLSKSFPFSRVDLYNVGEKIIFGEITFSPDSGFAKFYPESYDYEMGKSLKLPDKAAYE